MISGQSHWREPKLCFFIIALRMRMEWLISIASAKKEPVGPNSQARWHGDFIIS
jgi:hypothetical protein